MPDNLIGVVVGSDYVDVVLLQQSGPNTFTVQDETTLTLQTGDRPTAYSVLRDQFSDYLQQHHAVCVCIQQTALSRRGITMGHMLAAELRGVIQAAAAASCSQVRLVSKATVSRTFGDRKVDEYLGDDSYWQTIGLAGLKKGLRHAAFVVVCEFST